MTRPLVTAGTAGVRTVRATEAVPVRVLLVLWEVGARSPRVAEVGLPWGRVAAQAPDLVARTRTGRDAPGRRVATATNGAARLGRTGRRAAHEAATDAMSAVERA